MLLQQGLAREAVDGTCSSRHDGADYAFTSSRGSGIEVGDFDSLLINEDGMRARVVAVMRILDANPLLIVILVSTLDASQQLVLDLGGELKANGVVVGELFADVTRIGPGRLGPGVGTAALRAGGVGVLVVEVTIVVVVAGRGEQ